MCDQNWDIKDAHVVCRMLGFDEALEVYAGGHFGEGTGTIHYGGLECNGDESRILHCRNNGIGSCTHANDAGVRCKIMRLVGGWNRNDGRVELFMNDTWGTVCDSAFSSYEGVRIAREVSRSSYRGYYTSSAIFGEAKGDIKVSNFVCTSSGGRILDCEYSTSTSQCTHNDDISISTNYGVRIFQTGKNYEGPVGVFRETTWSRICANDWDIRDADVLCRELKMPGAIEATKITPGWSSFRYSLLRGGYKCEGYERAMDECKIGDIPATCTHDAGVICQTLRLDGGPSPHAGRLQVFKSGYFGGVCDDNWDTRDAHVACVQLGFPAGVQTTHTVIQPRTSGFRWMTKVYCRGLEKNIFDCPFTWSTCELTQEVWVECIP